MARAAITKVWPLYNAHFALLTETITALPYSVLDRYPVLRVLHPMTPVLANLARPFKPGVSADDARTISPEELDFLTLAQMIAFRYSSDMPGALGYARRLEDRILQTQLESRQFFLLRRERRGCPHGGRPDAGGHGRCTRRARAVR
ncbi:hypothetical protein M0722_17720 [Microbacterium sp. KSW4-16]|uniref:hypothetical protein n=1 Tax=Microbacterium aurugineum TaxID=2851642 RepID=UPI0020C069B0|nr:hypothetical protein [Microbacterium aurugineum]MCK8469039.1 hypothetical protein [Microbacterium aurugineum]